MRCSLLLLLCVIPLSCGGNSSQATNTSILGTWQAVSGEAFGKPVEGKDAWGMKITFAEGKATWHFDTSKGVQAFDGMCRIDPDGHSGWIDLGQPQSDDPSRVALGIYRLENERLLVHLDKDRPADFDQAALTKLRFKRVK